MSYGMIANAEGLFPGFRFVIWPLAGHSMFDALADHETAYANEIGDRLVLDQEPELRRTRRSRPARSRGH